MSRTPDKREVSRDTLQARFCQAIVEHFVHYPQDQVDAGDIVIAAGSILTAYLKAMRPESRAEVVERVVAHLRREVLGAGHA